MLLTRILTAAVLLPLVVGAILWLPTTGVALILAGVFLIGAWEWGLLTRLSSTAARAVFVGLSAVFLGFLAWQQGWFAAAVLAVAVVWWCLAIILLLQFPRGWDVSVGMLPVSVLLGLLLISAPFVALVELHGRRQGPELMLCLFILIWAADTGAYFAGRAFGRHKLAPRVSPGKTWEGAVGGFFLTITASGIGAWWFDFSGAQAIGFVALGAVVAVFSVVGDLSISMFKRQAGIKDAGNIFPGHGGVLDRLDSLLPTAPIFMLGLVVIA